MEPKRAFEHIVVDGCRVTIDTDGPDTMLCFACGFLLPAKTLDETDMFINALTAGHKQHHALGHTDHTAPEDAGWGLDAWLLDEDTMVVRCPVDPPRPQDYVYITCGHSGEYLELMDDWVEGLNLEL